MPQTVITRFAPSPTGNLHIGGARTALFAWAFARQHQGQLILRMEDTDLARSTPESTRGIIRDLLWLGLPWDQGPAPIDDPNVDPYQTQVGDKGPYFQSQRHELGLYNEQIERLLKTGQAYEDGDAVRFRMDKDITFDDVVYGPNKVTADNLEDFIIRKGEKGGGLPTFHFAVTVDDALMGITHVIRGEHPDQHVQARRGTCDALDFERPQWIHLPSIMNADGSKMSKRDKAKAARAAITASRPWDRISSDSIHSFTKISWTNTTTTQASPRQSPVHYT
ncbi:MAG: glutamate--tRNA ligase family protein [Phycisphaerales bacterium]